MKVILPLERKKRFCRRHRNIRVFHTYIFEKLKNRNNFAAKLESQWPVKEVQNVPNSFSRKAREVISNFKTSEKFWNSWEHKNLLKCTWNQFRLVYAMEGGQTLPRISDVVSEGSCSLCEQDILELSGAGSENLTSQHIFDDIGQSRPCAFSIW